MTYGGAPEVRAQIDAIINELSSHITALEGIRQAMKETGQRVHALHAYEPEVTNVGAHLSDEFGLSNQGIDDIINRHRNYIRSLEYYRDYRI